MTELYSKMPYGVPFDDSTMILRDGSVCTAFEVKGIDPDTSNTFDVIDLSARVAHILNGLDESYDFFIHRFRRKIQISGYTHPEQPFLNAVDTDWFDGLNASSPKEPVIILTIIRRSVGIVRVPLIGSALKKIGQKSLAELSASLMQTATVFGDSLNVKMQPLSISDGSFGSSMAVINFQKFDDLKRGFLTLVSQDVSEVDLNFRKDGIVEIDGGASYGAVISVKENPNKIVPGALDALNALDDIVVSLRYSPVHRDDVIEQARLRIGQMQAAEDLASTVQAQLVDTIDRIESGDLGVGDHSFTVLVRGETLEVLNGQVTNVMSICERAGFRMIWDRAAEATEMLACHPGNGYMASRSTFLTSENFSNLASLHSTEIGEDVGNVPWVEPVTVLETETGAPYRFNFHPRGNPAAEPTNGHTLVLGPSEGGKTTTTLFLAAQALRRGGRLIALDKDRAMEMPLRAMGGAYAGIKVGEPTGLNPLRTETGVRGQAWLLKWLSSLLESTGAPLTAQQSVMLKSAIRQNENAPMELRTFEEFITLIGDVDDEGNLADRVQEWGPDGRYEWVFGQSNEVLMDFAANDVSGLDLTEVLTAGTERTAILAYLFRALEIVMEERRPLILLVDEAWQVLDDPYFADELKDWLVTARKKQVVVIMLTQFPSQIASSASKSILQGLPNQIIFPNYRAGVEEYDAMGMTDGELAFILGKASMGRRALHRTKQGSTIIDVDLSRLGPLLTALGGGQAGINLFGSDYRSRPDFWKLEPTEKLENA